jgi:NADPH:quinone reductase-like Zn-dependent oxidoreductase
MEKTMKAISLTAGNGIKLQNVPRPERAEPGHLIIKMDSCAINPGDKAYIGRTFPIGIVLSLYDIYGVSGAGTVIETGANVPEAYKGKNVAIYRSLKPSESIVGTWCEYSHVHFLDCVLLPDSAKLEEYSGSLVNVITSYAFLKQISNEGHKGIISTAGTSATGIAMLGICLAYDFPIISIVRNEENKKQLEALGAKNIVVQNDSNFKLHLSEMSQKLGTTAVFDGVGGDVLNKIIEAIPNNSVIYCYGFLGGGTALIIHTSLLMRGIAIKGFSNFRTQTVRDLQDLGKALKDISGIITMPHFSTSIGKKFKLEQINEALQFVSERGGKAILCPFQ